MKRWMRLVMLCLCLCLLAGCAASSGTAGDAPADEPQADSGQTPDTQTAPIQDEPPWFVTVRIVDGQMPGRLLLAEQGEEATAVYTLSSDALTFKPKWDGSLRSGQLINVYYDSFTESWPTGFAGVSAIETLEYGFDDRCALYLQVLEDLWEKDSGLNGGVEAVGVDLTQTSLNPAEQAAVGWGFADRHGAELVTGSLDELVEQGYITATPLTGSGSGIESEPKHYFYEWENGLHFSIAEQEMEGVYYGLRPVTFDAQKWRSNLGAYFFSNCTAVQSALGQWSDYTVGTEMIS